MKSFKEILRHVRLNKAADKEAEKESIPKNTIKDVVVISAVLSRKLFHQVFTDLHVKTQRQAFNIIAEVAIKCYQDVLDEKLTIHDGQSDELFILLLTQHAQIILKEKYNIQKYL